MNDVPITSVSEEGQKYLDAPVYFEPAPKLLTPLADAIAGAVGNKRWVERAVMGRIGRFLDRTDLPPQILYRYEREQLRWWTVDDNGKLVLRDKHKGA